MEALEKQLSASAVAVPKEEKEITAAWLTAALHESGVIPPAVNVASIAPLVNIGEGRGYANFSWKVECTYDSPVNPDVPTKFVMKQLNHASAALWTAGKMRALADRSFSLEAYWYDPQIGLRDRVPIPQPKGYWTRSENAEDPSQDLGHCMNIPPLSPMRTHGRRPRLALQHGPAMYIVDDVVTRRSSLRGLLYF